MHHVLIVDDEELFAKTIVRILVHSGFNAEYVTTGAQCLDKLSQGFKGLVLMDINMPGMNGWETIAEVISRGFGGNAIFCMLTGYGDPEPEMDNIREHVIDYINKPVEAEFLVSTVRQYLDYMKPTVKS
jgi:DNA-binding NtrC family response regulator